jgi:hypothetical protein
METGKAVQGIGRDGDQFNQECADASRYADERNAAEAQDAAKALPSES